MFNKYLQALLLCLLLATNISTAATNRHYCIAADEVEWDYAPSFPTNLMSGKPFTEEQLIFVDRALVEFTQRRCIACTKEIDGVIGIL